MSLELGPSPAHQQRPCNYEVARVMRQVMSTAVAFYVDMGLIKE
jgi:hypothetical protein